MFPSHLMSFSINKAKNLLDMKNISIYTLFFSLIFASCEQDTITLKEQPVTPPPTAETPSAGSADFSKYVAVGNSLTAGYQAGALFNAGQQNSLAAILAGQFELVGGGEFNQPDINSENGFNTALPNPDPGTGAILGRLVLQGDPPAPAPLLGELITPYAGDKSALNNFGVPGILLGQALTHLTGGPAIPENPVYNPFYARFASEPGSSTIIGDAMAAQGTFFSFWLGNNDVLGYAVSGATRSEIFTSPENFTIQYQGALGALTSDPNIKGIVGNIPDVTGIPFFTTVPYNAVAVDQATADVLNAGYAAFNGAMDLYNSGAFTGGTPPAVQRPKISFVAGANPIVIIDETLPDLTGFDPPIPSMRQMMPGELVVLSAAPQLQLGVGSATPAPDALILTADELLEIAERIETLNGIISATANAIPDGRVAVADVNQAFKELANAGPGGLFIDGLLISASLAPPYGGFSEDGVHPNSRGYAFTANIFIEAINEKFGATIPKVNIGNFPGTGLPQ